MQRIKARGHAIFLLIEMNDITITMLEMVR